MTNKIEKLISRVANINPLEGRVLISPERIRTYKQEQVVLDDEKNKDLDPLNDEMQVKTVIETINYRFQKATVLQIPDGEVRVKVGDQIVYNVGSLQDFDLFKGVSVLKKYDIVAIIKE
ncbi:MAG: hypothetical protein ACTSQF_01945 [Candidatus Heimdallarchaeaceae archaeon]